MEFFDWNSLGSFAGAALAVAALTQITKNAPLIRRLPTQLWSYILAVIVLAAAGCFTGGLDVSGAMLTLINAALVSLATNGGYEAILRLKDGLGTD